MSGRGHTSSRAAVIPDVAIQVPLPIKGEPRWRDDCCGDVVYVRSIRSETRSLSESDSILTSTEPGADAEMTM